MRADAFCPIHGVRWSQYANQWGSITMTTYARCGQLLDSGRICVIPVQIQWEPGFEGSNT